MEVGGGEVTSILPQLHKTGEFRRLESGRGDPARTLSFLQAWLLGSQVGSNYKSK